MATPPANRAPWWVLWWVAGLAAANLITLLGIAIDLPLYRALAGDLAFAPVGRVALAGGWLLVFGALWLGLRRQNRWAYRWAAPLVTGYALTGLAWFILFARSDYDRGRISAQIMLSLIWVLPIWWIALRKRWLAR